MRVFFFTVVLTVLVLPSAAQSKNNLAIKFFNQGTQLARNKNFPEAIEFYIKVLEGIENSDQTSPKLQARTHYNLGVCLFHSGEKTKSVIEYNRAVEIDKNYAPALYALGLAQSELKNYGKAKAAFLRALEAGKNRDGEAWFDLAFVYMAENDYDRAFDSFAQAIRFGSIDTALAHNNLGVIFALKQDFAAAQKEFMTAWRKSDRKLTLAENNLRFIRQFEQNKSQKLLAGIVFGKGDTFKGDFINE